MGSSYRQDLNSGHMKRWEEHLRKAIEHIEEVCEALWEVTGEDGQFDNAADDGALRGRLYEAIGIIRSELPMTPAERIEKIKRLRHELAALEKEVSHD